MACGVDQSESHVCLRCRFLSVSARSVVTVHRSSVDAATEPRARARRSHNLFAALDVIRTYTVYPRAAWLLCGRPGASLLRLLRRDQPPLARHVLLPSFPRGKGALSAH